MSFCQVQICSLNEAASLAHNTVTLLHLKTTVILLWAAEMLCVYTPFCYVYLSQDLIKSIIFTASPKTFLSEPGILSSASAYWWRIQWLLVQYSATALVQAPAFLPAIVLGLWVQISAQWKKQIMSQSCYANSFGPLKGLREL